MRNISFSRYGYKQITDQADAGWGMNSQNQTNKLCQQCGKPIPVRRGGTLTQWIFRTQNCLCDKKTLLQSAEHEPDVSAWRVCERCGKRVAERHDGSITQWIFRKEPCSCAEPLIEAKTASIATDTTVGVGRLGKDMPTDGNGKTAANGTVLTTSGGMPSAVPDLFSGVIETFAHRFEVLERLGTGASATVDKARDTYLRKTVALKRLHSKSLNAEETMRFQEEAKLMGGFHHDNLVAVFDFGVSDNCPYLVMEYVEGIGLDKVLSESLPPEGIAIRMALQICDVLSSAHKKGIIHRDLNPRNILVVGALSANPKIKLLDFGLAKHSDRNQDITRPGIPIGTPSYMSPEQARGEKADARTDIYSLGCILFEMLTGSPPFVAGTAAELLMQQVASDAPTLQSRHPEGKWSEPLEDIVAKALAKDPSKRFQTVDELQSALREVGPDSGVGSHVASDKDKATPEGWGFSARKRPFVIAASVIAVGSALIALSRFLPLDRLLPIDEESTVTTDASTQPKTNEVKSGTTPSSGSQKNAADFQAFPEHEAKFIPYAKGFESEQDADVLIKNLAAMPEKERLAATLNFAKNVTEENCEKLSKMKTIRVIRLSDSDVTDAAVAHLAPLTNVREIHVARCKLSDKVCIPLSQMKDLQSVELTDTMVTDDGVKLLAGLKKLRWLCLIHCRITNSACPSLATLRSLDTLFLSGTKISDAGLDQLQPLTKLEVLDLHGCPVSDLGCETLRKLPHLDTLSLNATRVTDAGLLRLSALKKLRILRLDNCRISDRGLAVLASLPQISSVELKNAAIGDKGLMQLSKIHTLKFLDVSGCSKVSQAAIAEFKAARRDCQVIYGSTGVDGDWSGARSNLHE